MSLKDQISADMKVALRGGDRLRLGTIRMLLAAIQQREVDERKQLADDEILKIINRLVKQRREAAAQYARAGRDELEEQETAEAAVLLSYLPEQLDEAAMLSLIEEVLASIGATGPGDMGKVMAALREKAAGRADLGALSRLARARLAS